MIIGITGTDGAGKGTVVELLIEQGFTHYSAREIWLAEIERQGLEKSRANMRIVANQLRAKHGYDYSVKYYLKKIAEQKPKNAVIESQRSIAEVETLKKNGGVLLAVDADQHIRYDRIEARKSASDQVTFDEFLAQEALEMDDPDPAGMQKAKVITMADYTIMNDGSLEKLEEKVKAFLEMFQPRTIHKSAWLCIKDRKVLSTRSKGKDVYYIPGGKREDGETDKQAVIREINEELSINLMPEDTTQVAIFKAQAHGKPEGTIVQMTCFEGPYEGEITPAAEIAEVIWITYADKNKSSPVDGLILDWLKEQDLID